MDKAAARHEEGWPLHPRPYEYETLDCWVKRLAAAYGVPYRKFCHYALGLAYEEIDRLYTDPPEEVLKTLAAGNAITIQQLRQKTIGALINRCQHEAEQELLEQEPEWTHWLTEGVRKSLRRQWKSRGDAIWHRAALGWDIADPRWMEQFGLQPRRRCPL